MTSINLRNFEKNIFDNWGNKEKVVQIGVNEIIFRKMIGVESVNDKIREKAKKRLEEIYDKFKDEGPTIGPWFIISAIETLISKRIV